MSPIVAYALRYVSEYRNTDMSKEQSLSLWVQTGSWKEEIDILAVI